ncbi:MFS transporter [Streptomyces malaysiensis]|uniref:MFS transporter n=1 Tax=Streptomyces malaysiensis subsp. samsunensis TaxID=459658 RepID=A0A9X2M6F7_STRMQ|nr:MFS transporter [Streptomyces samsunensis]MCQ8836297.1 MFS transporter [Streptomyces samsunensis]
MSTSRRATRPEGLRPEARRAIRGGFFGFFVDMFDIYLPIVVLAPALIYFTPAHLSSGTKGVITGSVFAATLLGRPIGAFVFGHLADRIGRKRVTTIALTGFGTATLLMGALPGYQHWGLTSIALLIVLRFIDGIFLGGEYTAASPLAMEYSPKHKRGLYGGIIQAGYPMAFFSISLLALGLLTAMPAGTLNSAYVQWGWRIPFVIGGLMAWGLAIYYKGKVEESEAFTASKKSATTRTVSPLRELFTGDSRKDFLQVFVLMSGFWLSVQPTAAVLPALLRDPIGLSYTKATLTLVITYILTTGSIIGGGVLSQRIGRRRFLIWSGVVVAVATPIFYGLAVGLRPGFAGTTALTVATTVCGFACWGVATTYVNERFRTGVRASGFGLGYSLAVIIPSFYAYFQAALDLVMPIQYTGIPLLVLGGILVVIGGAWGPETRDVDFGVPVPAATPARTGVRLA